MLLNSRYFSAYFYNVFIRRTRKNHEEERREKKICVEPRFRKKMKIRIDQRATILLQMLWAAILRLYRNQSYNLPISMLWLNDEGLQNYILECVLGLFVDFQHKIIC